MICLIGFILTGHGSFAPGLMSALEMIAADQKWFEVVPFLEKDPLESLGEKITEGVKRLEHECQGVIIFTDLMGGTPFNTAMLAAGKGEKTEVIAGTNLSMLIEGSMIRGQFNDARELADLLVETGRSAVLRGHLELEDDAVAEITEEEGI